MYLAMDGNRLLRVPIDGGDPVAIRSVPSGPPDVSPDGKWILTGSWNEEANRWQDEVIPFEGGDPVEVTLRVKDTEDYWWRPDGGICHERIERGVGNLWCAPPGGGDAVQITRAEQDTIWSYAWSRDGKRLAVARGRYDQDIVLLKNFR